MSVLSRTGLTIKAVGVTFGEENLDRKSTLRCRAHAVISQKLLVVVVTRLEKQRNTPACHVFSSMSGRKRLKPRRVPDTVHLFPVLVVLVVVVRPGLLDRHRLMRNEGRIDLEFLDRRRCLAVCRQGAENGNTNPHPLRDLPFSADRAFAFRTTRKKTSSRHALVRGGGVHAFPVSQST
jgi:hypothetical protein